MLPTSALLAEGCACWPNEYERLAVCESSLGCPLPCFECKAGLSDDKPLTLGWFSLLVNVVKQDFAVSM